ncbi:MAG: DNA polymerase III subunit gamma and tau [Actinomycetota bacterium]|nr:DNA polymerase III subunit gamma and tau [Actinomycetota bacterium]
MSLALYRRYRPGSFAEVIGQEHVTEPLQQALRNGRVHHAYLFSGPRGCGKTSSARILARSLNCEQGPTPTPCGECDSCVALAPNGPGSLDVIEIDAASHGGVDDARDLRERAFYSPVSSRYKIYIIDEAHMVTREGFNALLKLVEEPPNHLKFVFATTEPDKVIGTIRSRTHSYPFRLIPPKVLQGLLIDICAREQVEVDPLVFPLVVRAGAGSARDALSVLDQLLAGSGPQGVTYASALALLGYTDASLLDEVVDAFAAGDGAAVFEAVDRVMEGGHDPRRFAADLLERYRDLLILDAVPDAGSKGLLDCPVDQLERMQAQAARIGRAELSRAGDLLHAGLTEMRGATAPRLLLELLCARVLLPGATADAASMLTRLERLERRMAIAPAGEPGPAAAPARVPAQPPAQESTSPAPRASAEHSARRPAASAGTGSARSGTAPSNSAPSDAAPPGRASLDTGPSNPATTTPARPDAAPPETGPAQFAGGRSAPATPAEAADDMAAASGPASASAISGDGLGAPDAAAVRRVWPQVLDAVKPRKRTTHALLSHAQVVEVTGSTLKLSFSTGPIARQFDAGVNPDVLGEALHEVLGVKWKVVTVVGAGEAPRVARRPAAPPSATSAPPAMGASAAPEPSAPSPAQRPSARGASTGQGAADRSRPPARPAPAEQTGGERPHLRSVPNRPGPALSAHEGFDPGDEPAEDVRDSSPALSGEEAAMALLQSGLGAKVIGELEPG